MKLKKLIAAVLLAAQVLGVSVAFAEETPQSTDLVSETEVETVVETEIPPAADEIRVYVSTTGNDSNDGSFEKPVQTIAKAVALASSLKSSNANKTVAVTIRGGDYYISKTIEIPSSASGTKANPFVIQNYNGEEVNIKGSTVIEPTKFTQLRDTEVLTKIPATARKYVGVYDLPKNAAQNMYFTAFTDMGSGNLGNAAFIVNDTEQTLARWPNTGFDRTVAVNVSGAETFSVKDGATRLRTWAGSTTAVAGGYFSVEYAYTTKAIKSIEGELIRLESKPYYGITSNKRYFVQNLIEELDSPGEYYIDYTAAKLYYYPEGNIANSTMEISTMTETMFYGNKLSNVTIKGITLKNTRGYGMEFPEAKNVIIDNCTLTNIGNKGIVMENATDCQIINSTISHIGAGAIVISGGDRNSLTPSNNLIDNNHIYDFAVSTRTYSPGINLSGVGTTITHNLINTSPSQGIMFSGNDHTMKYNEFYDLVNEPCDAGAIYAVRNYTMRGNEVAYNYFHDIQTTADEGGSIFVAGVYYDDLFSSVNTHHNVFYNCNLAVMIGGGRDHNFDNNIIVDCKTAMFMDARGVGWASYHAANGGQAYATIGQVPYNKEPWASRYPELASILDEPEKLGLPMGNSIQNNIMQGCQVNMIAPEMGQYGTVENNHFDMKVDTSTFKDYENHNFELKEGTSMAKNFAEAATIDMSEMGLREDKAESEKAKAAEESFRLVSPLNGSDDISNLSATFSWEKHSSASKYIVQIADDPEMQNVIMTAESKTNSAEIKFLPSGGKPYWWTVTAINDSNSMSGEYTNLGVPCLVISTTKEKTDKKELRSNITVLSSLHDAIVEGTEPGTYKAGYKARVKALLDEATEANASTTVLQKDIEDINARYNEILDELIDNINYEVVNVGDLLKNQGAWIYDDGYYTFTDEGTLKLEGENGIKNHYTNMIYSEPLGDNVAIKFGYKINIGSNYCMVGLQNDATFLSGGYDLIVKSNQIEIQKRVAGTTGDPIKSTALNFYISEGKWVDLEMGALKTGIGTYVYLMADGYMIDSFLDMEKPIWTGESKFVFGNTNGSGLAEIRAAAD